MTLMRNGIQAREVIVVEVEGTCVEFLSVSHAHTSLDGPRYFISFSVDTTSDVFGVNPAFLEMADWRGC